MADNYLEYQAENMARLRAKKEKAHKMRLKRALENYRKSLKTKRLREDGETEKA